ncbi:MAG: type II toxin-antitoxin system Phd/YefM family antitoxin [Chloroflexi bacterium]|nr:type II toxin-antitoxin system Phd/YefM family antitoxin [Chloroflexota bacterium]
MTKTITLKEAQATYGTVLEQVKSTGEPLIIEQDGKPFAVVMRYSEYQELAALRESEKKKAWQAEQERLLRKEITAFEKMKPDLLRTHKGKWVAILDGKLVDYGDDRRSLSKRVRETFCDRTMLIEQVRDLPRVYTVDSPERVRK